MGQGRHTPRLISDPVLPHQTDRIKDTLFITTITSTLDLQLTGDHCVGKPSAGDQPTRPSQPFILSGSINE